MPMMTRRHVVAATAAGLAFAPYGVARAGISSARLLVGFPAGGTTDVIARLLVGAMEDFASKIIVENRSGGAGRLAIEALKAAPGDGSVFLLAPIATMTLYPHVHRYLRYDPLQDFIPVTTVGAVSYLLTVGAKVPADVKTLADFVAWCRANPDQANYGSPGAGSPLHFTGVQFARAAAFAYLHIPYQGAAPVLQDLLGGQITSAILPIDTPLPYLQSRELRALATSGSRRSAPLPDVPTFREAGYPALDTLDWWGVFVPAATPADCVERLYNSIRQALAADEVRTGLAKLSIEIDIIDHENFARLMKSEFERWGSVVRASGFTLED
jgi:tripartite-type tricarboxylate transporter receptor subunit TctC